jgi:hypothetical protein
VDAAPEPIRPGAARVALAILPLPFVAVVVIPAMILLSGGSDWRLRHPMIAGVAVALAGLALIAQSTGIAIELTVFVAVNALYLPLVEEPALVQRYGDNYVSYMERVPRWLPRLGASDGVDAQPRAGGKGDQRT